MTSTSDIGEEAVGDDHITREPSSGTRSAISDSILCEVGGIDV